MPVTAIFLGSFLLFGIQPLLSRALLPSFGGTAAVWTCCLAAYQVLLLAGYWYAHWLAGKSRRAACRLHLSLLALSVVWLFGMAAFRTAIKGYLGHLPVPSLEILLCVQFFVGLPYVLLAANSTLLQAWLSRSPQTSGAGRKRDVYTLYAVSNLGSLLGLLLYPFVLEPYVSLTAQWYGLAAGLLVHTVLLAALAKRTQDAGSETPNLQAPPDLRPPTSDLRPPTSDLRPPTSDLRPPTSVLPPPLARPWLWFALPALSAFLLNAMTMHLSTDVMPIPLLWVLLLTAFLLSYILGFSGLGERGLFVWAALATLALVGAAYVTRENGSGSFLPQILIGVATLFICCSFLHAWLYHIRPATDRLTHFYLRIAAGGAFGGICASVVAPALFDFVLEYPLALACVAACCAWLACCWPGRRVRLAQALLVLALAASVYLLASSTLAFRTSGLFFGRNFYGCLRLIVGKIRLENNERLPVLQMVHGSTVHGLQSLEASGKKSPTAYYGAQAGGLSMRAHAKYGNSDPMRVGLIGLGAGTLACYGRANDLYRFFEINPMIVDVATNANIFTFIADSPATVECVVGDARKRLEEERQRLEPPYDVLVVDAYTGDYVPLHLATKEAFELYVDRLAPDGILALHISNWHMDLLPLCKAVARELHLQATGIVSPARGLLFTAHWVFLTRHPMTLPTSGTSQIDWLKVRALTLPTDEKGSLLSLIQLSAEDPAAGKPGKGGSR